MLEVYFLISSYALLATSFAMLLATRQLDWISIAGYTAALAAGFLIDRGSIKPVLTRRAVNLLRLGYLPILAADWRLFDTPPALAVIHFTLFASVCKLLERKSGRDWLWLYLVAFFCVLLAAGMTVDAMFFALLVVFLFAALSTLVAFEIRRAGEAFLNRRAHTEIWRETPDSRRALRSPRGGAIAGFSLAALAVIVLLATPLFMAMPRLPRTTLGNRLLRTESLSGFSNTVRLGEVGRVKLNPQVVMRVRVNFPTGQAAAPLRWRGVSFDYYDGSSWSLSDDTVYSVRRFGDSFQVEAPPPFGMLTEQNFFLEPLTLSTVFAAPRANWVRGLPTLERDSGDGLWTQAQAAQRLTYTVYSTTWPLSDAALAADSSRMYPPEIRRRYLQLPAMRDRRVDALAAEIAEGAATPLEIARRIEFHLQTSYGYTLNLRRTDDADPIADFLFNLRAGHCEYFASAMTVMLRSRRIPARLVNGFQMGEYSDVARAFTVRQSDAHSWVEVFFPQHGWIAFDPTPAAGLSVYDGGIAAQLRRYFEALELFWQERIVGFGASDQIAMFGALQKSLTEFQQGPLARWFSWTGNPRAQNPENSPDDDRITRFGDDFYAFITSPPAAFVLAALALAPLIFLALRRRNSWRRQWRRDPARSAVAFYQEMIAALERKGFRREPFATPREFAAALAWPEVEELTRLYERARFARTPLAESEITRIGSLLGEIRSAAVRRGNKNRKRDDGTDEMKRKERKR
ncbi:MAG: DUF3488 domain-containing protein [Acidobacteria bacterium]|nr:DUF3488 domain-containing protein [Acidobacteriota bacterium]